MAVSTPFIFPADRFPSFSPPPDSNASNQQEEFGPPLSFNPHSAPYNEYNFLAFEQDHFYEFQPSKEEVEAQIMEVLYNVQDDMYVKTYSNLRIPGWQNAVWRCCNVDRKLENDWDMGYIARKGSFQHQNIWNGLIEWRFNLSGRGLKVKNLKVRVPYTVFRDGKVKVSVCSKDDYTVLLDPHQLKLVHRARGWQDFIVRAELSGCEKEGVSYQSAQLFRQPLNKSLLNSEWSNPFKVIVEMEPI